MNYYFGVFKKYAQFEGRARRMEFWMFSLFNVIAYIVLAIIQVFVPVLQMDKYGILSIAYSIAVFVPSIALMARRLHDTNKSGWWQLVGFIPLLGWLFILIYACQDSTPGDNKYGPNPKGVGAASMPATPGAV